MALASLALARIGIGRLDAVLAIGVALIIAWSGAQILRASIPILVDERAIDARQLRGVVLGVPEIHDVRSVRSRSTASGQLFAEVTVAVAGTISVDRGAPTRRRRRSGDRARVRHIAGHRARRAGMSTCDISALDT